MRKSAFYIWIWSLLVFGNACKITELNIYELEEFHLEEQIGSKKNIKSDLQLISIAYSDLFGKEIPSDELNYYMESYDSIGDKVLVIDIIVRNFLNRSDVVIPSSTEMRNAPDRFVKESYKKFLVRQPTNSELWYFTNMISNHPELKPIHIYYALIVSDEYRYY